MSIFTVISVKGLNVSPGGRWAKYEMHISGDIAFAFKQYLMMTDDTDILRQGRLAEAILGIAKFWKSRSTYNVSRGKYDILGKLLGFFNFIFKLCYFISDIFC